MSLSTSSLDPSLLYFFALGPGTGESVLLRVPPDQWVVIDSFANARRPAAERIIQNLGGRITALVLTHPHQDHCMGFIELIDENPAASVGCIHPQEDLHGPGIPVDPIALLNQRAKPTYTRIWSAWQDDPSRKWKTFRNAAISVGDGTLTSLHPVTPLKAADWIGAARNDMSSVMRFTWHDVSLLLGADASMTSWSNISSAVADLATHQAMKVPHHGSFESLHASYGTGDRRRIWVVTPFASKRLPRVTDGEGLGEILKYVDQATLTSLPYGHNCEHEAPCTTIRSDLRDNIRPKRVGSITDDSDARAERYVAVAYDQTGSLVDQWYGAGTLVVSE